MKLYKKKLDSVEALKREKIRLRYERRNTKVSDLNPLAEMGRSKVSSTAKEGLLATVMELVGAKSNAQMAFAIAKPLVKAVRKGRSRKQALREEWSVSKPKKNSFLKKLVTEIAVGYVTGKAMMMAVHGVRLILKRRKAAKLRDKMHVM